MDQVARRQADRWIAQIFSAQAAMKGGVIRRSVAWVENEVGRDRFIDEVRLRGFCLLGCGNQYVVICRRGPIRRIL